MCAVHKSSHAKKKKSIVLIDFIIVSEPISLRSFVLTEQTGNIFSKKKPWRSNNGRGPRTPALSAAAARNADYDESADGNIRP